VNFVHQPWSKKTFQKQEAGDNYKFGHQAPKVWYGAIHEIRRQFGGGEGSNLTEIFRRIEGKNCRHGALCVQILFEVISIKFW
jgi:hypothetical protein